MDGQRLTHTIQSARNLQQKGRRTSSSRQFHREMLSVRLFMESCRRSYRDTLRPAAAQQATSVADSISESG